MKLRKWFFLTAAVPFLCSQGHTIERGRIGLNYTVGPSFIAGGNGATEVSSVEPGVGAGLQMEVIPNIDFRFDYDYLDASLRTQAITFGAQARLAPGSSWSPVVGGGLGFGKPRSGEDWGHFSIKLSGGMEKELSANISVIPEVSYQYVEGPDPFGSVHSIWPGIRLVYYFPG